MIYIIIASFIFLSGISKAIVDTISFHYETSVFKGTNKWFNPTESWKNKYEWFKNNKVLTWLISNPLVFVTDAWHMFGLLERIFLFGCLFFTPLWWTIPIFYLEFTIVFHIFFTYIFIKKK